MLGLHGAGASRGTADGRDRALAPAQPPSGYAGAPASLLPGKALEARLGLGRIVAVVPPLIHVIP